MDYWQKWKNIQEIQNELSDEIQKKYFLITYLTYLVLSALIAIELTNLRLNKEIKKVIVIKSKIVNIVLG